VHLEQLGALMNSLIGEVVTAKLIAGNSISLWFSVPPMASTARGIWIEPPWRIENQTGVETSSYGFPDKRYEGESDAHYRARFDAACDRSDSLHSNKLANIMVDLVTGDVALSFADGRTLRSFATDTDWEVWHYEDVAAGKKYRVIGHMVHVEQSDA